MIVSLLLEGKKINFAKFERPFKCTCCCCNPPEMTGKLLDSPTPMLGKVSEPCTVCDPLIKVFNKSSIQAYTITCNCCQCGYCCRTMHCPDFDENTNLCTSHDEQRWVICQTAPFGDPDFGLLLNLGINCTYLTAFLVDYLNKVFDKAMEMKSNES